MTVPDPSLLKSDRQAYFEQATSYLLETGEAHWICKNTAIVKELLWLWKFAGQPTVNFLQSKIKVQASTCLNCAFRLHQARTAAVQDDEQSEFDNLGLANKADTRKRLATCLDEWDCERFSAILRPASSENVLAGKNLDQVLCTLIEILLRPQVLICDKHLWEGFNRVMRCLITRKEGLQISGALKLPGVYMLCAHHDQTVRDWARSQVRCMGTLDCIDEPPALEWVVDEIVNRTINGLNRLDNDQKFRQQLDEGQDYIFSDDENVLWTAVLVILRQMRPQSIKTQFSERFPGFLPTVTVSVVERSKTVLAASQCLLHLLKSHGSEFWERSTFSPHFMKRILCELVERCVSMPVKKIALEILEEVACSCLSSGHFGQEVSEELFLFLSGSSMQFANDPTIGSMSIKVLVQVVNRMLDAGSMRKLPLVSAHQWIPHLLGATCSLNLPPSVRLSPIKTIQRLMELQTNNLLLILRRGLQPARNSLHSPPLSSDSPEWLGSMWDWLLLRAGVRSIPGEIHASILRTASALLLWLDVDQRLDGDIATMADLSMKEAILVRFSQLFLLYAKQLTYHEEVLEHVKKEEGVKQSCFALSVIANLSLRDVVVRLLISCFAPSPMERPDLSTAMKHTAASSPDSFARGFFKVLEEVDGIGLDGLFFPLLEHLFRIAADVISDMMLLIHQELRKKILLLLWRLLKTFMMARSRFRGERFQSSPQHAYFDRVTESFFFLFHSSWTFLKDMTPDDEGDRDSDDEDFDPRNCRTLLAAHEEWLGSLAKWGGVANLQIRRVWCACILHVLQTFRHHGEQLEEEEKELFRRLVERRSLWTDEQILSLCRELVPLGVPGLGNLGQSSLHALPASVPTSSRASRTYQGPQKRDPDVRVEGQRTSKAKETTIKRKKPRSEEAESTPRGVKEQRVGGLQAILADISGSKAQQSEGEQSSSCKLTVGNLVMDLSSSMKDSVVRDVLGTRSRRSERSPEELEVEFLLLVLAWDLRLDRFPHAQKHREVPVKFVGLDEYEDMLTNFLLEESWEQIRGSFDEARSLLLDASRLKVCVSACEEQENFNSFLVGPSTVAKEESMLDELSENDLVLLAWVRRCEDVRRKRTGRLPDDDEPEHAIGIVEKQVGTSRGVGRAVGGGGTESLCRVKIGANLNPRLKRLNSRILREIRAGRGEGGGGGGGEEEEEGDLVLVPLNHNLSTGLREFVALHSVRSLPANMQRLILDPMSYLEGGAVGAGQREAAVPTDTRVRFLLKGSLNEDQLIAIRSCLDPRRCFNLIQGPPGTGKTRTILALVAALFAPTVRAEDAADLRVLICAPSNAAVDEVAGRLSGGLQLEGEERKEQQKLSVSVVRVGPKSQVRRDVWEQVSLETLVAKRLAHLNKEGEGGEEGERESAKRKGVDLKHLKEEVERITEQLDKDMESLSSEAKKELQERRNVMLTALSVRSGSEGKINSELNAVKVKLRTHILNHVQVVCTTLSGAGSTAMSKLTRGFDFVIIDEAAQAIEPSTLIPLQFQAKKYILVGDPRQLPATVFSRRSEELKFTRSLFERLQLAGYDSHMLTVQYRMHPKIRAFPSRHFYENKLKDFFSAEEMAAPWHADTRLGPLVWYDIESAEMFGEGAQRNSRYNKGEARACAAILRLLQLKAKNSSLSIAVMSPYRRQVTEIRRQLQEARLLDLQVSSIDAFQGREVDVALLSCVRSGKEKNLGFVSDVRRMNVALTRARRSLIVLGNSSVLSQNEHWAQFIDAVKEEGQFFSVPEDAEKFFRTASAAEA